MCKFIKETYFILVRNLHYLSISVVQSFSETFNPFYYYYWSLLYVIQSIEISHKTLALVSQATKRPHSPKQDVPRTKRGRDDEEDEDEQASAEKKLKQLQAFAQRESDDNLKSPTVKPSAPSSTCSQSHWQQIGSLMLFTAAGVPESSKVTHEPSYRNHIAFNQQNLYASIMFNAVFCDSGCRF